MALSFSRLTKQPIERDGTVLLRIKGVAGGALRLVAEVGNGMSRSLAEVV